jgi:hypothetical protein
VVVKNSSASWARLAMILALGVPLAGCVVNRTATMADASETAAASASHASDELADVPVEKQPWRFAGHDGQIVTTPHYTLYTTLSRHSVVDRLPLFLERGLVQYTTAFGRLPMPESRLVTYLFETRNQWEAKTRQMLPDQAGTFLTLGRGGFTTRGTSVLYYIGRNDTLRSCCGARRSRSWPTARPGCWSTTRRCGRSCTFWMRARTGAIATRCAAS